MSFGVKGPHTRTTAVGAPLMSREEGDLSGQSRAHIPALHGTAPVCHRTSLGLNASTSTSTRLVVEGRPAGRAVGPGPAGTNSHGYCCFVFPVA